MDGREVTIGPDDTEFVDGKPVAIVAIVDIAAEDGCVGVEAERVRWLAEANDPLTGDEASIYAQHAENVLAFIGCEVTDTAVARAIATRGSVRCSEHAHVRPSVASSDTCRGRSRGVGLRRHPAHLPRLPRAPRTAPDACSSSSTLGRAIESACWPSTRSSSWSSTAASRPPGVRQVPLNFRWAEPELAYALSDSGARILITDRDPGALADLVDRVIRIDDGEYDELVAAAPRTPFDDAAVQEDETAGLFYTGGTTGASKGVILTHRNLIANATNMQMVMPLELDDVYLVMAPLFHAAGSVSVLQTLYVGAKHVILPSFDPGEVLDVIEREGVTATLGVPTMVAAAVDEQLAAPA